MRICVLSSSSGGNSTFIGTADGGLLFDAGLSLKATHERLQEAGFSLASIRGICISHEHSDHIAGLLTLRRKLEVPVFANMETREGAIEQIPALQSFGWNLFETGQCFEAGGFTVESFAVNHDARDPVGYVVRYGDIKAAIATDLGFATTLVKERMRGCHAIVIEANHDFELLQRSDRPWNLKQRIAGRHGHLSNVDAAAALAEAAGPQLQCVFLAHLSEDCNQPHLARQAIARQLERDGFGHVRVEISHPRQASTVWTFAAQS
jgi:phosphoribosyl 1,2-cyclic phosphodiesterase